MYTFDLKYTSCTNIHTKDCFVIHSCMTCKWFEFHMEWKLHWSTKKICTRRYTQIIKWWKSEWKRATSLSFSFQLNIITEREKHYVKNEKGNCRGKRNWNSWQFPMEMTHKRVSKDMSSVATSNDARLYKFELIFHKKFSRGCKFYCFSHCQKFS